MKDITNKLIEQIENIKSFEKFIEKTEQVFQNNSSVYFKVYVIDHYAYNYDCMVIYIDNYIIEKPLWDHYPPDIIPSISFFKELENIHPSKYIYFTHNINNEK